MRSISTTAVVLITGVLAALLIAYVFSNNNTEEDNGPHCIGQYGLGPVKDELFRRAAALRGTNDPAFAAVKRYSVIRAASRIYRKRHGGSKVSCVGSVALDLPPGAVAGGRPSLTSNLSYELEAERDGTVRLLSLNKADAIVTGLAAIGQSGQASEPLTATPAADEATPPAEAERQPAAKTPPPPGAPGGRRPEASRPPATPEQPRAVRQPKSTAPLAAPKVGPRPATPVPPPISIAKPSFNCRYARTGGEIAVCHDPSLASLDRQMAAQFYSALSVARPGQRTMLQRSRNRFLSYRDSCRSTACIAGAYRARMQEISGIMNGDW